MAEPDLTELAASYASSQQRIDAMTRGLDDDALAVVVPCCPLWTVKDLVGHLSGVLEDRLAGRLPTGGFADWTGAQVQRHRDQPVGDVLDEWRGLPVELSDAPPSLHALSFDAVTHEHDLCQALGTTGDTTTESVRLGARRAAERMGSMLVAGDAPGVVATTEDGDQLIEGGTAPIGLRASRFDLMRLVTGRMSRRQATALGWDGDATPVLGALFADGFFTLQPDDYLERRRTTAH
jgi:uncharacterized protein (TIGR03083 family)